MQNWRLFCRDRELPIMPEGELLALLDTGAYGMVLASNYNTRPRAAEVLVNGKSAKVIRRRETLQTWFAGKLSSTRCSRGGRPSRSAGILPALWRA